MLTRARTTVMMTRMRMLKTRQKGAGGGWRGRGQERGGAGAGGGEARTCAFSTSRAFLSQRSRWRHSAPEAARAVARQASLFPEKWCWVGQNMSCSPG